MKKTIMVEMNQELVMEFLNMISSKNTTGISKEEHLMSILLANDIKLASHAINSATKLYRERLKEFEDMGSVTLLCDGDENVLLEMPKMRLGLKEVTLSISSVDGYEIHPVKFKGRQDINLSLSQLIQAIDLVKERRENMSNPKKWGKLKTTEVTYEERESGEDLVAKDYGKASNNNPIIGGDLDELTVV